MTFIYSFILPAGSAPRPSSDVAATSMVPTQSPRASAARSSDVRLSLDDAGQQQAPASIGEGSGDFGRRDTHTRSQAKALRLTSQGGRGSAPFDMSFSTLPRVVVEALAEFAVTDVDRRGSFCHPTLCYPRHPAPRASQSSSPPQQELRRDPVRRHCPGCAASEGVAHSGAESCPSSALHTTTPTTTVASPTRQQTTSSTRERRKEETRASPGSESAPARMPASQLPPPVRSGGRRSRQL